MPLLFPQKFGVQCSYIANLDLEEDEEDFDDYFQYLEVEEEDFNYEYFENLEEEEYFEDFNYEYCFCQKKQQKKQKQNQKKQKQKQKRKKNKNYEYCEDFNYEYFEDFEEEEEVTNDVWMDDYCHLHKILLVGEGDFSFSTSLARAFGFATNMVATSLNSIGYLCKNYGRAKSNIQELTSRGCKVVHGVDATKMVNHLFLKGMKFDRIVFNFPHAGFFPITTSRATQLRLHVRLVGKFLENAKMMINPQGEIHVRHKSNGFFREWDLEFLGSFLGLQLLEQVRFNFTDYPGYRTKYGFGGDKNFNCSPSKTYKFGLL